MYTLREFLLDVVGLPDEAVPSDEIYCSETDIARTKLTNRMQDSLAAYSYTLVRRGCLSITPTHLSRIVRQVSGRTVVDYINQMLLMEATWLLQTSDLHIAAIADRLHFADPSSFTRFFLRLKGVTPKAIRKQG